MAFNFGGSSTPAFGTSTTGFSFGGQPSTPAFGAAPTPAFGAPQQQQQPASSAGGFSFATSSAFGAPASNPPPTFGGVSTPAFSFAPAASSSSLFGAATTPAFGSQPQQQQQPQQQPGTALVTTDGRPVTHSTKWEELSPQAQQYLIELDKTITNSREECSKLDADARLTKTVTSVAGTTSERFIITESGIVGDNNNNTGAVVSSVEALATSLASLTGAIRSDTEGAESLREVVLHLVRHAESSLNTFKQNHAWREASKSGGIGTGGSSGLIDPASLGRAELPSPFLREAVASFEERLRQYKMALADLEQAIGGGGKGFGKGGGSGYYAASSPSITAAAAGGGGGGGDGNPAAMLRSLEGAVANLHDCLLHTAARLQSLEDKVARERDEYLNKARQGGDDSDPFAEAERQEKRSGGGGGGNVIAGGGGGGGGGGGMLAFTATNAVNQQPGLFGTGGGTFSTLFTSRPSSARRRR